MRVPIRWYLLAEPHSHDRAALVLYPQAIDELFTSWDPDGSGKLEFEEMRKLLRGGDQSAAEFSGAA